MSDKDVKLAIKANIKDVQGKLEEVTKALEKLEAEAQNTGKGLTEASKGAGKLSTGLSKLNDSLFGNILKANLATEAFGALVGVLKDAAVATVRLGMETEQIQAKFGAMKNNLMQASEAYQIFNNVGRDTNYSMEAINDMGVKLINLGYNAEQAAEMIKIVSDTAAGLGKGQEGATALMDSLNRMRSTGLFTIRDMKALQEQGLHVEEAFAKAFGVDTQKAIEMVKDDAIDGKDAFEILANYMQNDFANSMSNSKNNVVDLWGDLAGNIQTMCGEIGSSIFEAFNQSEIIQELINFTQDLIDLIRSDGTGAFSDLKVVASFALDIIQFALHNVITAVKGVIVVASAMYDAFRWIGTRIANALSIVLTPLSAIYKLVTGVMATLGKEISDGVDAGWSSLVGGGYYDEGTSNAALDAVNYKGNGNYRAKAKEGEGSSGGSGGSTSAYDAVKAKAEQVAESIKTAWQNMFKTKDELVDIWYNKEKERLDEAGLDAQTYEESLNYLLEMRKQKHAEIAEAITKKEEEENRKRAKDEADKHKAVISYWESMANTAGSAFADCIMGAKSFGSAFKDIIKQIIQQLLQALVVATLLSAFGGAGVGGFKNFGSNFGKAFFGSSKDGGLIKAASGGLIAGAGTGRSDSIPTMLSNGEYVVNAASTKQYLPLLENINNGGSNNGGALAGNSITLNVSAIDSQSFETFLGKGGLNTIKQAMVDDDRMNGSMVGVF